MTSLPGGLAGSKKLWSAIVVVLVALNFRPAIVAVAPLLDTIAESAGLSASVAGLLLTLPVLCFGLIGPSAPALSRRFGLERMLGVVLVAVIAGSALRLIPSVPALFLGTFVLGAGIAVGNILLPVLIKRDFSGSVGMMSGLYTLSITSGATIAAGITLPVARAVGVDWNVALAGWGLLAIVGLAVLVPGMVASRGGGVGGGGGRGGRRVTSVSGGGIRLVNDPVAWFVTVFFGLQSLNFYSMTTWIPTILIAHGFDAASAGLLLSLNSLVSIVPAMLTPLLMTRMKRQSGLALVLALFYAIALVGFMVLPTAGVVWVVVLGVAQGATLAMALTLIILRAPDTDQATRLSGMTQSWGYAFAAVGPFAIGAMFDLTQTWVVPLAVLAVLIIPQAIVGYQAGLPRSVGARASARAGAASRVAKGSS